VDPYFVDENDVEPPEDPEPVALVRLQHVLKQLEDDPARRAHRIAERYDLYRDGDHVARHLRATTPGWNKSRDPDKALRRGLEERYLRAHAAAISYAAQASAEMAAAAQVGRLALDSLAHNEFLRALRLAAEGAALETCPGPASVLYQMLAADFSSAVDDVVTELVECDRMRDNIRPTDDSAVVAWRSLEAARRWWILRDTFLVVVGSPVFPPGKILPGTDVAAGFRECFDRWRRGTRALDFCDAEMVQEFQEFALVGYGWKLDGWGPKELGYGNDDASRLEQVDALAWTLSAWASAGRMVVVHPIEWTALLLPCPLSIASYVAQVAEKCVAVRARDDEGWHLVPLSAWNTIFDAWRSNLSLLYKPEAVEALALVARLAYPVTLGDEALAAALVALADDEGRRLVRVDRFVPALSFIKDRLRTSPVEWRDRLIREVWTAFLSGIYPNTEALAEALSATTAPSSPVGVASTEATWLTKVSFDSSAFAR
jgi:hypothetical protein